MKRLYERMIEQHFDHYDQMAFLCGPRQVGKTTVAKAYDGELPLFQYLNWDNVSDRTKILGGYDAVLNGLSLNLATPQKPILILDELHKYKEWKNYLKGLIDTYKGKLNILVTGSAKLNVFRRGGDSLMGRYFLYRMHPLSVGELAHPEYKPNMLIQDPKKISEEIFQNLFTYGGFPEPFLKQDNSFYNRWQNLREQQIIKEDIRSITKIQELAQLEVLTTLLKHQAGQLTSYSELAKKVGVSSVTIQRWIRVLESFYYCFTLRPWTKNVTRSLLKEPKIFLWDWSTIEDRGARIENFVANHLLKAVHYWTDMGLGNYALYFLRTKEQKEIDFLITQNNKPWMMIEVKASMQAPLSKHLHFFQPSIHAEHVLQLAFDMPYVDQSCFDFKEPKIVSLRTFLSQLV